MQTQTCAQVKLAVCVLGTGCPPNRRGDELWGTPAKGRTLRPAFPFALSPVVRVVEQAVPRLGAGCCSCSEVTGVF